MPNFERREILIPNYSLPVKYETVYQDQRFFDWLETVAPGHTSRYLQRWISTVSAEVTDQISECYPDGGRVFTYPLPQPYPLGLNRPPAFRLDVKGVGLTYAGYKRSSDDLTAPDGRYRELMYNHAKERDCYFGNATLFLCSSTQKDHDIITRRGLQVPQVVAVVKLLEFCYEGKAVDIGKLKRKLKIDGDEDFGMVLRIYDDDLRLNSLMNWNSCHTPNIYIERAQDEANLVNRINKARLVWHEYQVPRLRQRFIDFQPDRYYQHVVRKVINETAYMVSQGIAPITSFSNLEHAYHTHLQNTLTNGSFSEWSPIAYPRRLTYNHQLRHLADLIAAAHDSLVTLGLLCLDPTTCHIHIPNSLEILRKEIYRLSKIKIIKELMWVDQHHAAEQLLNFATGKNHLII